MYLIFLEIFTKTKIWPPKQFFFIAFLKTFLENPAEIKNVQDD